MNTCPNCSFQNPEEIHICLRCAASLVLHCANCGAELPSGNRYCGQCGSQIHTKLTGKLTLPNKKALPDAQANVLMELRAKMPVSLANKISKRSSEMIGQRKEVTVAFIEIANYHQATQSLDSETLYLAVDELMRLLADVVYKYEGTIDKFTGSGLIALFGIPLNHENDPERAVRAALEIQQLVTQLRPRLVERYLFDFQMSIGINTGVVITGKLDIHQHLEYTVVGDTLNLAAHLRQICEPGKIMASFSTYQRTRPVINYRMLPLDSIPATAAPAAQVFQPLEVRFKPGQARGLPGLQVPMIGRSEDFRLLKEALSQVRNLHNSQVVLVGGEAGIGKTRLIAEFRNVLAGQPVGFYQGTCAAYLRIAPYRVVAGILRNMLGLSELDPESVQREALRQRLEYLELDLNETLPYLLQVLGLLQSDPILSLRVRLLEPSMLQRQTHVALRSLLLAEARQSLQVLVFDDLHWVDQASQQFIQYLVKSIEDEPVLLILVSRDFERYEHSKGILAAVQKRAIKPTMISLSPLSREDARLLVDQLIQDNSYRAEQLKTAINQRSGGNPYYTEELVRMMIDHGALVHYGGSWHVNARAGQLISQVPATLQDIILARFDLLPHDQQGMLQVAAVLGNSFGSSLHLQVVGLEEEIVSNGLRELEEHDFLLHTMFGAEDGYLFKHPMVREAIYHTMLKRDLQRLHLRVAECIEGGEHWLPGERLQFLAEHYVESLEPKKAIPYLLSVAQKAALDFANEAVIHHYRRALDLIKDDSSFDSLVVSRVRVDLAAALKFTGDFAEAASLLNQVIGEQGNLSAAPEAAQGDQPVVVEALRELADIRAREGSLDEAGKLLDQALGRLGPDGRREFPALWRKVAERLAWVNFRKTRLEEAYSLADLVLLDDRALELEDPITLASLYNTIGGIYWSRLRFQEAIESVQRSLEIYRSLNYQWGTAISQTNLGVLHFSIGKWQDAVKYMEQADRVQVECGFDPERATNLKNMGEVLLACGDLPRARSRLEVSLEISERLGMELTQVHAELGLGRLSILEGKSAEASMHLSNARLGINQINDSGDLAVQVASLEALVELDKGNYPMALHAALRAQQMSTALGDNESDSEIFRLLGIVYAQLKDYEQAEAELLQAVDLAVKREDRYAQGRALVELGRMYLAWSHETQDSTHELSRQAENLLNRAIQIFGELGARHELMIAQASRAQITEAGTGGKRLPGNRQLQNQVSQVRAQLGLPQGEWYQAVVLTILLSARQEVEEELIFETIHLILPNLVEIINDNGGQAQPQQGRLIAVFGAPTAHEDDAERAVETAIQVLNFYHMLYSQTCLPVTLRLGISMGKIVAGRLQSEASNELIAAGEALQLSQELADACTPAHAWVSQAVRNATAFRFEFMPVSAAVVAQLADAAVFELTGVREQILPVRGLIGLKTPFVGRLAELNHMQHMSQSLSSGTGGLIWLEGDAGIGKSRLMREFANRASNQGLSVWRGVCTTRTKEVAFSLFSDLLSQAFDIQPNLAPEEIYKRIDLQLATWPAELAETRPFLEVLIGVQPSLESYERIVSLEPEQLRRQTFVALHRVVSRLTQEQPLVLILDDLQWVDSISADLLLYLSHLVISHPLMFICAQRYKELSAHEQTLQRVRSIHPDRFEQILLLPLSVEERRELLDEFLSAAALPESLRTLIIQQSGGNPYYIEEFVRMLVEQDFLRVQRGRLEVNQDLQADTLSIPSSLESLIRARVDSLPASPRNLLQVAAVLGNRFHHDLLNQVTGRTDTEADLNLLQSRGMLNPADEFGYTEFSHPMIETIVYNTVLRAQRKILHARAGDCLEVLWAGQVWEHAEELAYHFGQAEIYGKALDYLILAGERAAARHANDAAVSYFERASEMLGAVSVVDSHLRWRITTGLGEVYQFIGNYEASLSALRSGEDMAQDPELTVAQRAAIFRLLADTAFKKGDPDGTLVYLDRALEIIGEPSDAEAEAEAARIFARMGWSYFIQAGLDRAEQAVQMSLQYARHAGERNAQAAAENLLGGIYWRQRNLAQALYHTRLALDFWNEIGYSWGVAVTLSNLGILEIIAGRWSDAFLSIQNSLRMRQEMGDVEGVAVSNLNLGFLTLDQGKFDTAEAYFHSSLAISRPFRISFPAANSCLGLARCLIAQGRLDEVEEVLHEGLRLAGEINARDVLSELQRTEGELLLARGQVVLALEKAQQAAELAEASGSDAFRASAMRLAARCMLLQGQAAEALQILHTARQVLEKAPDELEDARLHALSADVLIALQQPDLAQEQHQAAREVFERLGAAHDLSLLNQHS